MLTMLKQVVFNPALSVVYLNFSGLPLFKSKKSQEFSCREHTLHFVLLPITINPYKLQTQIFNEHWQCTMLHYSLFPLSDRYICKNIFQSTSRQRTQWITSVTLVTSKYKKHRSMSMLFCTIACKLNISWIRSVYLANLMSLVKVQVETQNIVFR